MPTKLIVAGIGTDVGKTVVAAILTTLLQGTYWKPIECGPSDTTTIQTLLDPLTTHIHPPTYSFKAPLSPHHAAYLENQTIDIKSFNLPHTSCPLVIESVGGISVPLTHQLLSLDLFKQWSCHWILVCKHYLGSINHTLLTLHMLQAHHIGIRGLIFNGTPYPEAESVILGMSQLPCLGRLLPEPHITSQTIQHYAKQWTPQILQAL